LHRTIPRKRHQMRHLCDFACFRAKQVLSQLSYRPTFGVTFILKHFRALRNPFLRFSVIWSEPPFETVFGGTLFASVVQSQILSRLGKVDDRVREHRSVGAKSRDQL